MDYLLPKVNRIGLGYVVGRPVTVPPSALSSCILETLSGLMDRASSMLTAGTSSRTTPSRASRPPPATSLPPPPAGNPENDDLDEDGWKRRQIAR